MKRKKHVFLAAVLAGVIGGTLPVTALAASPEFARTPEEWEGLRDNRLEYDEIGDLIHEYNATVQNNQYEYNEFVKDYGTTKDDVADEYRQLADDLEADKSGDDSAMSRISDLQLTQQAKQLREQADDNVEDSHTYYLTYSQAEDNLVLSAQSRFISYYSQKLELQEAQLEKQVLENELALVQTRRQAGTATDMDVLDAQEAVLEQESAIEEQEQSIESTRIKLITMLGWSGSDQPEIGGLPEADLSEIDGIDLEADQQTALDNNYTLQINQRKLENAQDSDNRKNIQNTIEDNKRQIKASVTSAWQDLQTAKRSLEQARSAEETQSRSLSLAAQKRSVGMVTGYEYRQEEISMEQKKLETEMAELSLLESLETYRWNVNGLASAE
ncbi:MAG: TolC family protein [Eubacteriales bacterium]|nr:TolC family protein [Eubacteriales bacterium]